LDEIATLKVKEGGFTNITEEGEVHPFKSVTVTLYVPAPIFDKLEFELPPGVQKYVYPGVPPLALTDADPLVEPKHETF
jgi:hypothetical protein